jgi:hypothetical protein
VPHLLDNLEILMYGISKTLPMVGCACALAATLACNSGSDSPAAPSAAPPVVETGAAPDGSTLKANPPTPMSPTGDVRLTSRQPTMVARNADGKFANRTFAYEFHLMEDGGNVIASTTLSAGDSTTTWNYTTDLARDTPYRWRVRATLDGAVGPWSSTSRFLTVKENRTPNPVSGRLPRPDITGIISQVINANPGILAPRRSCQDPSHGGDPVSGWEFLDKLVDTLRLTDTRWAYNGKRGNAADPSHDVVAYNWGSQPDEGTTDVYIFDVLLGHCGGSPSGTQIDITGVGGALGRWTSRGRFAGSQGLQ